MAKNDNTSPEKSQYPFSIVRRAYIRITICIVLVLGSWFILAFNARLSTEFTGGITVSVSGAIDEAQTRTDLATAYAPLVTKQPVVSFNQRGNVTEVVAALTVDHDDQVVALSNATYDTLVKETGASNILARSVNGPSIGQYMKSSAAEAVVAGLILMAVYMIFAFAGVRSVISPAVLAAITIGTMIFDISVPSGAYGLLMAFNPTVAIDSIFVTAILTNMGYSINDTIVIFDRIRENLAKYKKELDSKSMTYARLFEMSLWQTMRRSLGISISTLLVIGSMFVFGSGAIEDFAFTMGMGVIAGSFSSIFFAAPLAYVLLGKFKEEFKNK